MPTLNKEIRKTPMLKMQLTTEQCVFIAETYNRASSSLKVK